jgi:hypothetical protein
MPQFSHSLNGRRTLTKVGAVASTMLLVMTSIPPSTRAASAVAVRYSANGKALLMRSWDHQDTATAERDAMEGCEALAPQYPGASPCELIQSFSGPGYLAIFCTNDGKGYGFAMSPDRQTAVNAAYGYCKDQGACPSKAAEVDFDNGERIAEQRAQAQAQARKQEEANAKARGRERGLDCSAAALQSMRYRETCMLTNCIRIYDNGCAKTLIPTGICFGTINAALGC